MGKSWEGRKPGSWEAGWSEVSPACPVKPVFLFNWGVDPVYRGPVGSENPAAGGLPPQ